MDEFEQLKTKIDSGDLDTINKVISGEAFMPPADQPSVESAPVVEGAVVEEKPDVDSIVAAERSRVEAIAKARELELKAELDRVAAEKREAEAKAKEYEDYLKNKKKQEELEQYKIEETDEEKEFASSFEKNTRKKIELIEKKLVETDNEDLKELIAMKDELRKLKEQQEAELKRIKDEDEANKVRQIMYSEINDFQNRNERFRIGRPVEDARADFTRFADKVAKHLKLEDTREVNKAIYAIAYADTIQGKVLRDRIAASNDIVIPQDLKQYMDLVQVVDAKNGLRFNKLTGESEPIVDRFGNQVRYASMDEAYKVSNFYDEIAAARMEGVRKVQEKLETRDQSAKVIPSEQTSDPSRSMDLSDDRIGQLLKMPASTFKDPKMKEELMAAYRKLGIEPPKI
jgi:hypothetical protein